MEWFFKIFFLILSYLIGSIPFGFVFAKAKGIDLRTVGSGNIGATNCGRVLGRKYAVYTYILDAVKGAVFVVLYRFRVIPMEWCLLHPMLYGFMATLGNTFSIYLGFKGGKSVSTGSGAVFGYCPYLIPIILLIFFLVKKVSKLVSLGSLICGIAGILSVLICGLVTREFPYWYPTEEFYFWPYSYWYLIFTVLIVAIVYIRHKTNIENIINHTEKPTNY